MDKTFLQSQVGDMLYYVVVKDSKLVYGNEIKTATISDIESTEFEYKLRMKLSNGESILVNWNNGVDEVAIKPEKVYKSGIIPFNFTIYSTTEAGCKEYINRKNEGFIGIYGKMQIDLNQQLNDIHNELVKLSGIRLLGGLFAVKKPKEVTTEAVIV